MVYYGRHRESSVNFDGRVGRVGAEGDIEAISFIRQAKGVRPPTGYERSLDKNCEDNFEVAVAEKQNKKQHRTED